MTACALLLCLLLGLASCGSSADAGGAGDSGDDLPAANDSGGGLHAPASPVTEAAPPDGQSVSGEPATVTTPDLLGTVIRIAAYGVSEADLVEALDVVRDIDDKMSVNKADSEISKVNAAAGAAGAGVEVSPETYEVIALSLAFADRTEGAFDPALGGVTSLWKQDGSFGRLPEEAEVDEALGGVGAVNVSLEGDNAVRLSDARTKLDLGGVAKGYACEKTAEWLKAKGVKSALLDFGGNIYAFGRKANGEEWRVGVKTPLPGDSGVACTLTSDGKAIVTSGAYEKYFERNGKLYHHIIDPGTGRPSDSGLLSVTIVADSATEADALSTACFVQGLERGMALLTRSDGCEGIFITGDENGGSVYLTPGLKDRVEITDGRFTLEEPPGTNSKTQ